MVDLAKVRALALALPGTEVEETEGRLVCALAGDGFAWTWLERVAAKKPRLARADVLAVRCVIERKEMLIEAAPQIYFDDDHYRGYPAVLVRLAMVQAAELEGLLRDAWRGQGARPARRR